ncbi:MAG: hypothetical protein EPN20_03525 [Magnetospirillum sp.]|nr:MAG: hypothetical protein EPN20_03525 [Magnetospirillum sp.]
MITALSDTEFQILDALRVYRYLTAEQLLRLKVAAHASYLYRVLRTLIEGRRAWVGRLDHGAMPGVGRIPTAHYLTEAGAKTLAAVIGCETADIPYPRGAVMVRHTYLHRLHTVDCEIAVRTWAADHGHTVDFFHSYFDVTGANRSRVKSPRRALTKIDLAGGTGIIPDAVFQLTDPTGAERLFLLEMYNQHRTRRMGEKLAEYRFAIGEGAINRQFAYPHHPRILAIFEDERALALTAHYLASRPDFGADFVPFFFFQTLPGLLADFRSGWRRIGDARNQVLF